MAEHIQVDMNEVRQQLWVIIHSTQSKEVQRIARRMINDKAYMVDILTFMSTLMTLCPDVYREVQIMIVDGLKIMKAEDN